MTVKTLPTLEQAKWWNRLALLWMAVNFLIVPLVIAAGVLLAVTFPPLLPTPKFILLWLGAVAWIVQVIEGSRLINWLGEMHRIDNPLVQSVHFRLHYLEPMFHHVLLSSVALMAGATALSFIGDWQSARGSLDRYIMLFNLFAIYAFGFIGIAGCSVTRELLARMQSDLGVFKERIRPPKH